MRGRVIRERALVLVAVLLLAMLATGCSNNPKSAAAPPASSDQPGAATTKRFVSPAMGVAFRYPADWQLQLDPANDSSQQSLKVEGAVFLTLNVRFERWSATGPPQPFMPANAIDLEQWSRSLTEVSPKARILRRSLVDVGGLLMAAIEFSEPGPPEVGRLHGLSYTSSQPVEAHASYVYFALSCPESGWKAEQSNLLQILGSMRFSGPRG